jgi:hypothetical protein
VTNKQGLIIVGIAVFAVLFVDGLGTYTTEYEPHSSSYTLVTETPTPRPQNCDLNLQHAVTQFKAQATAENMWYNFDDILLGGDIKDQQFVIEVDKVKYDNIPPVEQEAMTSTVKRIWTTAFLEKHVCGAFDDSYGFTYMSL